MGRSSVLVRASHHALGIVNWADVDRNGGVIYPRAENAKTGVARKIAIVGDLESVIERQAKARSYELPSGTTSLSPFVFHQKGSPVGDIRKAWARACMAAGLPVT